MAKATTTNITPALESSTPSRRFILSALSGSALVAITPAVIAMPRGGEPDPVYAAMDAYRDAWTELSRVLEATEAAHERIFDDAWRLGLADAFADTRNRLGLDFLGVTPDAVYEQDHDLHLKIWQLYGFRHLHRLEKTDPAYQEADARERSAHKAVSNAAEAFFNTVPTTLAGAVAMLAFPAARHREEDEGFAEDEGECLAIMASVATYLKQAAGT